MNRKMLLPVLVAASIANSSATAWDAGSWCFNPYVGMDAQIRHMDFKRGWGNNLFNHNLAQGNLYVGTKFCPNVGVELGYEASITRARTVTLTTGELLSAGAPIPAILSPAVFRTRARLRGPHADLVGFYRFCDDYPLEVIGSIGVSLLKATFERRVLKLHDMPLKSSVVRTFSRHKVVLRLMGGLQYMLGDNLGARATIGWVNTHKLVIPPSDGLPNPTFAKIKPKNSTIAGLGLFWIFN